MLEDMIIKGVDFSSTCGRRFASFFDLKQMHRDMQMGFAVSSAAHYLTVSSRILCKSACRS